MIDRVTIQNYKSLKDVTVTFDSRLTVLVGANGSGKSSVLKCIHLLCELTNRQANVPAVCAVMHQGLGQTFSGDEEPQMLELAEQTESGELGIRYRAHPQQGYVFKEEGRPDNRVSWECIALLPSKEVQRETLTNADQVWRLSCWPVESIAFQSSNLASPSLTKSNPPRMSSAGIGLPSLLKHLLLSDRKRFDQTVGLFVKICPNIRDVRLASVPIEVGSTFGEMLLFDLPNRKGVPASQMSDGTLYALGLIVKILDPQRPKTLLIDDIDHGFHPKAQTQLVELIKKLLDEFPDLQIIATSHSPYILSGLGWDEVRVLHLRDDGTTVARKLSNHPKFEKWHTSITPGEFWNFAGEDWAERTPAEPAR